MKNMITTLHKSAAILAFLLILSFFISSLFVELFGRHEDIVLVKTMIFYGIWVLIPTMAVTGITGAKMAPKVKSGPIASKKKRMPFIALNGLLILTPAAIYLHYLAKIGQFDGVFYGIQIVELIAGFTNLTLMALNIRDARKVKSKTRSTEKSGVRNSQIM